MHHRVLGHWCKQVFYTTNMEANENDVSSDEIFNAPKMTHESNMWPYFGFFKWEGQLDKTHTICKQCSAAIKYFSSTTNLATHLKRWHGADTSAAAPPSSPLDATKAQATPSGSKGGDTSIRSITHLLPGHNWCHRLLYLQRYSALKCERQTNNPQYEQSFHWEEEEEEEEKGLFWLKFRITICNSLLFWKLIYYSCKIV